MASIKKDELKAGDVVVQRMTVHEVRDGVAICQWFDGEDRLHRGQFPVVDLQLDGPDRIIAEVQKLSPKKGDVIVVTIENAFPIAMRDRLAAQLGDGFGEATGAMWIVLSHGQTIAQFSDEDLAKAGLQRINAVSPAPGERYARNFKMTLAGENPARLLIEEKTSEIVEAHMRGQDVELTIAGRVVGSIPCPAHLKRVAVEVETLTAPTDDTAEFDLIRCPTCEQMVESPLVQTQYRTECACCAGKRAKGEI